MKNSEFPEIETVGIKAFSKSVSAYVKKASLGIRIFLSDRGKVVAELHKPGDVIKPKFGSILQKFAQQGKVSLGNSEDFTFERGKPLVSNLSVAELLDEIRGSE